MPIISFCHIKPIHHSILGLPSIALSIIISLFPPRVFSPAFFFSIFICFPFGSYSTDPLSVNTSDLDLSLEWGIHCMSNILNPQDRDIPYFECWVLNRPQMKFNSQLSVGNVTGRALYALLMAENALGKPIDQDIINKYRKVLIDSYGLVRGIPADPSSIGGPYNTCWIFNNGAGMRGLLGLAQFRNDTTAIDYFNESLDNYQNYFVSHSYSWLSFQQTFGLVGGGTGGSPAWPGPSSSNVRSFPFSTWSISRYYDVTGSSLAFDMAYDFGKILMAYDFPPDGSLSSGDHGFSIVGKMSALAQVAEMTNDSTMKERIRSFYDHGLKGRMSQTGWYPERLSMNSDVGEINNTCEIIQTALHLGDWGWPQYYQDAERFTRSHLLPSQLLDNRFVPDNTSPPTPDAYYDVKERSKGAYGFPAPYGHLSTMNPYFNGGFFFDIVAGGIAEVAEVKMNCYQKLNGDHYLNLLFDFENDDIKSISPYTHGDTLSVTLKTPGSLFVRLSDWVVRNNISVHFQNNVQPYNLTDYYLEVPNPPINETISISFPLPVYETSEVLNGRKIEMMWKGDSLIAMSQMQTGLPYFTDINDARKQMWIESLGGSALALSSPLDGNGTPTIGQLLEEVGISSATDRKGLDSSAVSMNGHDSRLQYRLPYFPDENYTFLLWVRPEAIDPNDVSLHQIVSSWSSSYDDPLRITIIADSLFAGIENETPFMTSGHKIDNHQWYQIAVVKDKNQFRLFINGASIEQIEVPAQVKTQAKDIGIGYNPHYDEGEYFNGILDDVNFYARSLSIEEIADIYRQSTETSVFAYPLYH
jgi:hypothetical protein